VQPAISKGLLDPKVAGFCSLRNGKLAEEGGDESRIGLTKDLCTGKGQDACL
jgi:hypothetical protein